MKDRSEGYVWRREVGGRWDNPAVPARSLIERPDVPALSSAKTAAKLDRITVGDRPGLCQTASVGSRRRSMDTSTASPHRTLVAIPAYNEAATIRNVVERVRLNLPHCDLVVVNDGSTDATATPSREPGQPSSSTCAISDTVEPFKPQCSTRNAPITIGWSRSTRTASTTRRRSARCWRNLTAGSGIC